MPSVLAYPKTLPSEYIGACNLGAIICHLRDLTYEFEHLGTPEYNIEGRTKEVPSVLLIDNQTSVRMSKITKLLPKIDMLEDVGILLDKESKINYLLSTGYLLKIN